MAKLILHTIEWTVLFIIVSGIMTLTVYLIS